MQSSIDENNLETNFKKAKFRSYNYIYDYIINEQALFNTSIKIMPEEFTINFYYYLLEKAKGTLDEEYQKRINEMLSKLEDIPLVQEDIQKRIKKEEEIQIQETIDLVLEKQKIKKMGPLRRFAYKRRKEKNNE